jgi:hypothetical protein
MNGNEESPTETSSNFIDRAKQHPLIALLMTTGAAFLLGVSVTNQLIAEPKEERIQQLKDSNEALIEENEVLKNRVADSNAIDSNIILPLAWVNLLIPVELFNGQVLLILSHAEPNVPEANFVLLKQNDNDTVVNIEIKIEHGPRKEFSIEGQAYYLNLIDTKRDAAKISIVKKIP